MLHDILLFTTTKPPKEVRKDALQIAEGESTAYLARYTDNRGFVRSLRISSMV